MSSTASTSRSHGQLALPPTLRLMGSIIRIVIFGLGSLSTMAGINMISQAASTNMIGIIIVRSSLITKVNTSLAPTACPIQGGIMSFIHRLVHFTIVYE